MENTKKNINIQLKTLENVIKETFHIYKKELFALTNKEIERSLKEISNSFIEHASYLSNYEVEE